MKRWLTPEQRAAVQEEVDSFRADLRSAPPPSGHAETLERIVGRMPELRQQSGRWDTEALLAANLAQQQQVAAARLAEEVEKRKAAEHRLEKQGDRIWQVLLLCIGILIAAGAAGIGIGRASAAHDTSHHGE